MVLWKNVKYLLYFVIAIPVITHGRDSREDSDDHRQFVCPES